jgi:REP element-mobilizing transposase RayT
MVLMRMGLESPKYYHVVWVTPPDHAWLKIAAAARFCEQAVRQACARLGLGLVLAAVFPDRIHLLITAPADRDRQAVGDGLRQAVCELLREAGLAAAAGGSPWQGSGWCAPLSHAAAAAAVRRALERRLDRNRQAPAEANLRGTERVSTPAATARP